VCVRVWVRVWGTAWGRRDAVPEREQGGG
jgi:hypothetical protein